MCCAMRPLRERTGWLICRGTCWKNQLKGIKE
jgi:hypothetical protein